MDSAKLLYSLLNIILILLIISIGISIVFGVLVAFGIGNTVIKTNTDISNFTNDPLLYVFGAVLIIIYVVFTFGIWELHKAAATFLTNTFYTATVFKAISKAGKSFVLTGIFAWVIDGLSRLHFKGEIALSISDMTFTYLFITSIGLFVMLMSTVIQSSINLKEENDLTI